MGIKKIARPLNHTKNDFIKWLNNHEAENIDEFEGRPSKDWDYYRMVDAFIGDKFLAVNFMMCKGKISIDCFGDWENKNNLTIEEFKELLSEETKEVEGSN